MKKDPLRLEGSKDSVQILTARVHFKEYADVL